MSIRVHGKSILGKKNVAVKTIATVVAKNGSLSFIGSAAGQLNFSNSPTINLGTGDFTAEWWQYQTDSNGSPRPWGIGPWSTTQLGISLEAGAYVWINGSMYNFGSYGNVKNAWHHFAIVRSSGTVKVYKDGTSINGGAGQSVPGSISSGGTYHLTLGGEGGTYGSQTYGGKITDFRLTSTAVYTTNFTPPTAALTQISGTIMLISAKDDTTKFAVTGSYTGTATANSNVTWTSGTPY